MGFFTWKEEFSVHIEEMDNHHKKLFNLLNGMYEYNEKQDRDPEFLNDLFTGLSDYVTVHFNEEEKLLAQAGFPGLEEQRKQHRYFREQLNAFREEHFRGKGAVPESIFLFIRDWFLEHVLEMDRQYGEFFRRRSSWKADTP